MDAKACAMCRGSGVVDWHDLHYRIAGEYRREVTCPDCSGTGYEPDSSRWAVSSLDNELVRCGWCDGLGMIGGPDDPLPFGPAVAEVCLRCGGSGLVTVKTIEQEYGLAAPDWLEQAENRPSAVKAKRAKRR